jgi:predicted helicase
VTEGNTVDQARVSSVIDVLEALRRRATSSRDLGDRFERLIQSAFKTDRTYRERFTDVWLWMEWADRVGEPDTGIDLVAKTVEGGLVAIQCKFYDPEHMLVKADIDSFFTASGREPFSERIIMSTTDRWSRNAEKALERQQIPVVRLGIDDLDAMSVEWSQFDPDRVTDLVETPRKQLRPHQEDAAESVRAGFGETDRGQMIMACGTGKTLTALRIAEEQVGTGGTVLFLAPSIALVSQALKEWTVECETPIRPFAVCSDVTAGQQIRGDNAAPYDLPIPPTTDMASLRLAGAAETDPEIMTVIFSTYQSIQVVADLQTATGLVFDLIVGDEAHRTAGTSDANDEASHFVKVHDDSIVPARKRLYMTATPRVYKAAAKVDAAENEVIVASMDDPETFGPEFHRLGFGEAVEQGLLADYRVLILTVEEESISRSFQQLLSSEGELNLPDVAKFVGCLSGLAKLPSRTGKSGFTGREPSMQRAVAFWSRISESQRFADQFDLVAEQFNRENAVSNAEYEPISVPTRHVDGTEKIASRREDIRWLKESPPSNECRVLTNAKCLTEGVDVPALDAVMFLKPRRSKIDIVQAVGRVMRKPPGKEVGYIILPIAIPAGEDPASALDRNRDYDVVWDVLQALRSHDERFNAYINRIALRSENVGDDPDAPIEILDANPPESDADEPEAEPDTEALQGRLFTHEDWVGAIYTKIVNKVGTRTYWEDWADDVVAIANRQRDRITNILDSDRKVADEFDRYVSGLRSILNDGITRDDAIAMLSQHLITSPIFDALFGSDVFEANNPVAQTMDRMVQVLEDHHLDTETRNLEDFYRSVQRRVEGIPPSDGQARQTIIKDLYGRFFKKAFPQVADSLGIVYTPVEVVDFMIRATQAALMEHFDASITDKGVHILDPFTGTGTFITRLLQSGYIDPADLERKYRDEIHANEFLLLAYYIAAVNIETAYKQLTAKDQDDPTYHPFPGIVLTDTFELGESGEGTGVLDVFPVNNERANRQKNLDLRVIIGNPPYSAGQASQNDNAPNRGYPVLDSSITATYAEWSTATLKNSLYDSYIRAIRWASNRVLASEHGGIVAYVTNGGYIDGNTADGLRLTLADEFHHIYVYNLRGNQRTAGERSRKEGGKIFGAGSRATVAIMLLIKKPGDVEPGGAVLHYRDIGDYLSRERKLEIVDDDLNGTPPKLEQIVWQRIEPNDHGDWINQRSDTFGDHLPVNADDEPSIFEMRTRGLLTARDAWNWNSSRARLEKNTGRWIEHYNNQVRAFADAYPDLGGNQTQRAKFARAFVDLEPTKISWDRADFKRLVQGQTYSIDEAKFMAGTYRPFHRRHANSAFYHNNTIYRLPKVYPNADVQNLTVGILEPGGSAPFSVLMTAELPDDKLAGAGNAMQHLAQYIYDAPSKDGPQISLLDDGATRRHNVTDYALGLYRNLHPKVSKDDIFFYVYGILHSPDYRETYTADLKKSLPRIPQVESADDFWAFAGAGRELARLHTEYEQVKPWQGDLEVQIAEGLDTSPEKLYRVTKMRYANDEKTAIVYNEFITISNIPERVHDYGLGARSALDWVLETNRVRRDKQSGIVNDPNDWSLEHGDPKYIFDLVGQVATVSIRTLDIIDELPSLRL